MSTYQGSGRSSMAIACLCGLVTSYVLLEDVIRGYAPVSTSHVMSGLALILAVAAGHWCWPEARHGRLVNAALLFVLALGATGYVLAASTARNADVAIAKGRAVDGRNAERATARSNAAQAEADWQKAKADADAECKKVGPQCTKKRDHVQKADSHRLLKQAAVANLGPDEVPNAGWLHVARVLSALPGVTAGPDAIAQRLDLLLPALLTVIAELGLMTFTRVSLEARTERHRTPDRPAPKAITERAEPLTLEELDDLRRIYCPAGRSETPGQSGPDRPAGGQRVTREAAEQDLVTLLALGQSVPSQLVLAQRWNRPKQTVSDWLRHWERSGLIPARKAVGRAKMLQKA